MVNEWMIGALSAGQDALVLAIAGLITALAAAIGTWSKRGLKRMIRDVMNQSGEVKRNTEQVLEQVQPPNGTPTSIMIEEIHRQFASKADLRRTRDAIRKAVWFHDGDPQAHKRPQKRRRG